MSSEIEHEIEEKNGNLVEDERFLIVDRIETVVQNGLGAETLPNRISRQAEHVHFSVGRDPLIGNKLARYHLHLHLKRRKTAGLGPERRKKESVVL
jgi:hypothetical protein